MPFPKLSETDRLDAVLHANPAANVGTIMDLMAAEGAPVDRQHVYKRRNVLKRRAEREAYRQAQPSGKPLDVYRHDFTAVKPADGQAHQAKQLAKQAVSELNGHGRPAITTSVPVLLGLELPPVGAELKLTVDERVLGTLILDRSGMVYRSANKKAKQDERRLQWDVLAALMETGILR